ncbi:mitochondrial pyrimidine nucleotide transporter [Glomus cerebriforme]|uniref:Mitochondrial pyrimidine nucleotide transporter n=1 Tax=Glomus cerebriforme TaxID=658196 RepID=A0A397T1V6_9GLOM|nr:mitochondrial pyrimidine nucleotide transporter [Glomus cerebriforme]
MAATTANNQKPLNFSTQTSVISRSPTSTQRQETNKAWLHFVAGGVGGMVGATVTSPLDVVKTRLQSTYYLQRMRVMPNSGGTAIPILGHFIQTGKILSNVYHNEGWKALFKGLGPNLVGVVPSRSINFFTYGNGKRILTELNGGQETSLIHLTAAFIAGITTSTATNPIWLVKTRMQLQSSNNQKQVPIKYKNSLDCVRKVVKEEGIRALYKGLSASYLGVIESTIQWVTYEYFKLAFAEKRERKQIASGNLMQSSDRWQWSDKLTAAAFSKLIAAGISYPHEVVRTRMRQLPENGEVKYKGLIQCIKTILQEEGIAAMYGGMTAHLIRVVPNAIIMFFCYEAILHYGGANKIKSSKSVE